MGWRTKKSIPRWIYIKINCNFKVEILKAMVYYPIKLLIEIPGIPT